MAESHDASARDLMVVRSLGEEFERLGSAEHRRVRSARSVLRPLALTGLTVLLLATAAGAATGVLSVGAVIPGGADSGFEHDGASPEQTVLATGRAPVAGPWRVTAYRSEGIVDEQGELLEAKGLPCIRLLLTSPPPTNPINGGAFCLAPGKPDFNVSSVPVVDEASGGSELIVYGFAPADAARVKVTASDGRTFSTDALSGGPEFPGAVWVIAAPADMRDAELDWVDRSGKRAGAAPAVSRHFARMVEHLSKAP